MPKEKTIRFAPVLLAMFLCMPALPGCQLHPSQLDPDAFTPEGETIAPNECGDGTCAAVENCENCLADCGCKAPEICFAGACCTASCTGKKCGSNGCGGQCPDTCAEKFVCNDNEGTCVDCTSVEDCDDGDPCTKEACVANACSSPQIADCCLANGDCNDNNDCTVDSCGDAHTCLYAANPIAGKSCGKNGTCNNGICLEGCQEDAECDDDNDCTYNVCGDGKCEFPPEGGPCDDGNLCTLDDYCANGECASGVDKQCDDDGEECTELNCNADDGQCHTHSLTNTLCEDGKKTCFNGVCKDGCELDSDCSDENPCTAGSCVEKNCQTTAIAGDCDDGDKCTAGDYCHAGACSPGTPLECDDGNECTTDSCGQVEGCKHAKLTGTACIDGDICTIEKCDNGECVVTGKKDCNDNNDCTTDTCDPTNDCQNTPINDCCTHDDDCDDEKPCTEDACGQDSQCKHEHILNCCQTDSDCGDQMACKGSKCVGVCVGVPCNDDNPCTEDNCENGTCNFNDKAEGAGCGDQMVCKNGECVGVCEGMPCNDSNPCTDDNCEGGACVFTKQAGPKPGCDDGNDCTLSTCVNGNCDHQPLANEASCGGGWVCWDEKCVDPNSCEGFCGKFYGDTPGTCNCDKECFSFGDCCEDACTFCKNDLPLCSACPSDWTNEWGSWEYKRCDDKVDWQQAESICIQQGDGSHLVSICGPEENDHVVGLYKGVSGNDDFWIGYHQDPADSPKKENWVWTDEQPADCYKNWKKNEPNDNSGPGSENCAHVYPDSWRDATHYGQWNDDSCASLHRFVCKKPAQ